MSIRQNVSDGDHPARQHHAQHINPAGKGWARTSWRKHATTGDKLKTRFYSKRSFVDRRCCEDMRESHNLDYFENDGIEKRKYQERRTQGERRQSDWIRVGKWCSVYVTKQ